MIPGFYSIKSGLKYANDWRIGGAATSILGMGLSLVAAILNRVAKAKDETLAANTPTDIPEFKKLHPILDYWKDKALETANGSRVLAGTQHAMSGLISHRNFETGCAVTLLTMGVTGYTGRRLGLLTTTILGTGAGGALWWQGHISKDINQQKSGIAFIGSVWLDAFSRQHQLKPTKVSQAKSIEAIIDRGPQARNLLSDLPRRSSLFLLKEETGYKSAESFR